MLKWISKYLGWRHWAVLNYNAVFENLFVLFYIALINKRYDAAFVADAILLILFSIFATTYGYLINDFSDRELDRLHGKSNTFENDTQIQALWAVGLILALSVLASLPFWGHPYFLLWAGLWLLIATFYSLKPIRLKERGTWGIIFVVMAQRVLPLLIIFAVFDFNRWPDGVLLVLYILFRGLSSDVNHQLSDYRNDLETGTSTFAVQKGYHKVQSLFYASLHTERVLLLIILLRLSWVLPIDRLSLKIFFFLLIAVYAVAFIVHYAKSMRDAQERQRNPFDPQKKDVVQFLHHAYPSVLLPVGLNLILACEYFPYFWLLLIQIIVKRLYSIDIIKNNFLTRFILKMVKKP